MQFTYDNTMQFIYDNKIQFTYNNDNTMQSAENKIKLSSEYNIKIINSIHNDDITFNSKKITKIIDNYYIIIFSNACNIQNAHDRTKAINTAIDNIFIIIKEVSTNIINLIDNIMNILNKSLHDDAISIINGNNNIHHLVDNAIIIMNNIYDVFSYIKFVFRSIIAYIILTSINNLNNESINPHIICIHNLIINSINKIYNAACVTYDPCILYIAKNNRKIIDEKYNLCISSYHYTQSIKTYVSQICHNPHIASEDYIINKFITNSSKKVDVNRKRNISNMNETIDSNENDDTIDTIGTIDINNMNDMNETKYNILLPLTNESDDLSIIDDINFDNKFLNELNNF
jgi:hypothetical protein